MADETVFEAYAREAEEARPGTRTISVELSPAALQWISEVAGARPADERVSKEAFYIAKLALAKDSAGGAS